MQSNPHPRTADQAEAVHGPETAEEHPERTPGAETTPQAATRAASGAHEATETTANPAEPFVPRTERECWVDIAAALNAAHAAGMPVGIDLDGTLTDRRAWSVAWDRNAEQWTVAGYDDGTELAAEPDVEDLASADNPTRLRWGLNDVLWGDDDTVIVLMSDEQRKPYWLELEPDRAAVLRQDLAGPDGGVDEPEPSNRPCGHDDYHGPHEWADRPGVWCPGHSFDEPAPVIGQMETEISARGWTA